MLGRPLFVWLILFLLVINIFGSVSGLLAVASGQGQYAPSTLVISVASSALAIALIPTIWMRHPVTRALSWSMFAVLACNQAIAFFRHQPNPDFDMSTGQQTLLIGIFTLAMITLYALPSLYFQRSRYLKGARP